jgi:hypothetical protein
LRPVARASGLLLSQIVFTGIRYGRHRSVTDMGSLGYSSRPALHRGHHTI